MQKDTRPERSERTIFLHTQNAVNSRVFFQLCLVGNKQLRHFGRFWNFSLSFLQISEPEKSESGEQQLGAVPTVALLYQDAGRTEHREQQAGGYSARDRRTCQVSPIKVTATTASSADRGADRKRFARTETSL